VRVCLPLSVRSLQIHSQDILFATTTNNLTFDHNQQGSSQPRNKMPRRKQHCPKRMEFGEDGLEGEPNTTTTGEFPKSPSQNIPITTSTKVISTDELSDNETDEDGEEDEKDRLGKKASPHQPSSKVSSSATTTHTIPQTQVKPHNPMQSPKGSNKRKRPPSSEDEDDEEISDEDKSPSLVVNDEEDMQDDEDEAVLDFSVKAPPKISSVDKTSPRAKESRGKVIAQLTTQTFTSPLDLSVKKSSSSSSNVHLTSSISSKHSTSSTLPLPPSTHPLLNPSLAGLPSTLGSLSRSFLAARSPFSSTAGLAAAVASLTGNSSLSSSNLRVPSSSPPKSSSPVKSSSVPSSSTSLRRSSLTQQPIVNGQSPPKTKPGRGGGLFTGPSGLLQKSPSSHGRQNPWQTQWINRSSEQTRDVFTCVWCKESFRSLQEMTIHMKESPRCGMAGMQHAAATSGSSSTNGQSLPLSSSKASLPTHHSTPHSVKATSAPLASSSSTSSPSSSTSKDCLSNSVLAKNNVTLPRKLVRGQDVWLGRGAEQTRQILKCMWCGQSFKSLDEMTKHMRETQHYTNIISQEQIISWRTPEDKQVQQAVNAVLTCKVCDEVFGSLKDLTYHMSKNSHYKEHMLRTITEGGNGRRRQTREKRKKSLPVRKLLELERMESTSGQSGQANSGPSISKNLTANVVGATSSKDDLRKGMSSPSSTSSLTTPLSLSTQLVKCDECGVKVEARNLLTHIKSECKKSSFVKGQESEDGGISPKSERESPQVKKEEEDKIDHETDVKEEKEKKNHIKSEVKADRKSPEKDGKGGPAASSASLSALQSLIDKSFDMKLPTQLPVHRHHRDMTSPLSGESLPSASSRKVNGSRVLTTGMEPRSRVTSSTTKTLSAVEKWMTLAKERGDGPSSSTNANVWSSSVSSSSENSSWLCSDEEGEPVGQGVNLKTNVLKKPEIGRAESPTSSRSTPSSPSSPPLSDKKVKIRKHHSTNSDSKTPESTGSRPIKNEEEERREEIEMLKRNAVKISVGGVDIPDDQPIPPSGSATKDNSGASASTSSASLSALEKLIEKSFDSKKKNAPTGFLQRLGIDEEVCPPWQPGALNAVLSAGFGAAGLPFMAGLGALGGGGLAGFQPWLLAGGAGKGDSSRSSSSSSPVAPPVRTSGSSSGSKNNGSLKSSSPPV